MELEDTTSIPIKPVDDASACPDAKRGWFANLWLVGLGVGILFVCLFIAYNVVNSQKEEKMTRENINATVVQDIWLSLPRGVRAFLTSSASDNDIGVAAAFGVTVANLLYLHYTLPTKPKRNSGLRRETVKEQASIPEQQTLADKEEVVEPEGLVNAAPQARSNNISSDEERRRLDEDVRRRNFDEEMRRLSEESRRHSDYYEAALRESAERQERFRVEEIFKRDISLGVAHIIFGDYNQTRVTAPGAAAILNGLYDCACYNPEGFVRAIETRLARLVPVDEIMILQAGALRRLEEQGGELIRRQDRNLGRAGG